MSVVHRLVQSYHRLGHAAKALRMLEALVRPSATTNLHSLYMLAQLLLEAGLGATVGGGAVKRIDGLLHATEPSAAGADMASPTDETAADAALAAMSAAAPSTAALVAAPAAAPAPVARVRSGLRHRRERGGDGDGRDHGEDHAGGGRQAGGGG